MKNIVLAISLIFSGMSVFSQVTTEDTLHWVENKKLEWKDFKGKSKGQTQATMLMNATYKKILKGKAEVETIFDRKRSWATKEEQTAQELKFYQTEFDLYEAESRKLRKIYKETKFGVDHDKVFQEKYNAAVTELNERDQSYKEDTEMGNNAAEIEKWAKIIQGELKELEGFKK